LCSIVTRRERLAAEGFRQAFQRKPQTLVYRQPQIAGLERLERLGRCLYRPARADMAPPELATPELVSL
jgi:hypothetical protein